MPLSMKWVILLGAVIGTKRTEKISFFKIGEPSPYQGRINAILRA